MKWQPQSKFHLVILMVLCLASAGTVRGQYGLTTDGGFESPAVGDGPTNRHVLLLSAPTNFGGWVVESGNIQITSHYRWNVDEGTQAVDMNGNTNGTIYQDVPTIPGHEYQVSFLMAGDVSQQVPVKTFDFWWGPTNGPLTDIGTFTYDTTGQTLTNLQWVRYAVSHLVSNTNFSRIRFESTTTNVWGPGLDDVSVTDSGPTNSYYGLISDGGFEVPAIGDGPTNSHVLLLSAPTNFDGWVVESGNIQITSHYRWNVDEGIQAVDMNGNTNGTIYQDVPTIPGHEYQVSFLMAGDVSAGPILKTLNLWWGPTGGLLTNAGTFTYDSTGQTLTNLQWVRYAVSPLPAFTTSSRIRFESTTAEKWGPGIDDVSDTDLGTTNGADLTMTSSNGFSVLQIAGTAGFTYQVQSATNLVSPVWTPLTSVTLSSGSYQNLILDPPTSANQFYRTLQTLP